MGILAELRKDDGKIVRIPLATGRIVTFGPNIEKCVTTHEFYEARGMLSAIGLCDSVKEMEEHRKLPVSSGCTDKTNMNCDFESFGAKRSCIRCGREDKHNVGYRRCSQRGLGDRVARFIQWAKLDKRLGFSNCSACSERRRKLNAWDRARYRKRWEKKNGKTKFTSTIAGLFGITAGSSTSEWSYPTIPEPARRGKCSK